MAELVNIIADGNEVIVCLRISRATLPRLMDCVEAPLRLNLRRPSRISPQLPTDLKSAPPEMLDALADEGAAGAGISSGSNGDTSGLPPLNLTFTPGGGGTFEPNPPTFLPPDVRDDDEHIPAVIAREKSIPAKTREFILDAATAVTDALGITGAPILPGSVDRVSTSVAMAHMAKKTVPAVHVDLAAPFLGTGTPLAKTLQKSLKDEADSILVGSIAGNVGFGTLSRSDRAKLLQSQIDELDASQGRAISRDIRRVPGGTPSQTRTKRIVDAFQDVRARAAQNLLILQLEVDPEEDPFA